MQSLRSIFNSKTGFFGLALLGALAFNNWILGFFLNAKLFAADGSISELSAAGQSYHEVFRTLDIASGIVFIVVALWWYGITKLENRGSHILFLGCLILGASNLADGLMPLSCSETLNTACNVPISLSLHHIVLPGHAYSSVGVGVGYFLLPLGGWIYARQRELREFKFVSQLALALAVVLFISILREYARVGVTVRASGGMQQFQMIAFGVWVMSWGYFYLKKTLRS